MEDKLISACKQLRFNSEIVGSAKKIKAETHLEFLLELFTGTENVAMPISKPQNLT